MDRQIVDPDPGKNYNTAVSNGDPNFEMEKNIYITLIQIIATLRIVMLNDTVLSFVLSSFDKI